MSRPAEAGRALVADLDHVEWDDPLDLDRLVWLLDTTALDAEIVDRDGQELGELVGIDDREELLEWVVAVRPVLIERAARQLNECEASMGGNELWIVCRGMVVTEGGVVHRDLVARARRRPPARVFVRPFLTRVRGRARRGRRPTSRRSRARSPGRQADDDPEPLADLEAA